VPRPRESSTELPLATRLWFCWVCLFRVLFNPTFAARVWAISGVPQSLPAPADRQAEKPSIESEPRPSHEAARRPEGTALTATTKGLQLLALLQREGRLIDFLEQDVTKFSDEEVGAAARIVHEGCRKVIHRVTSVSPLRAENEGAKVVIGDGFSPAEITLVGNVQGAAPYRGTLRHRGWRVSELRLPETTAGHDSHVLAPAEVEL
jgi:hypothetical protein